MDNFEKLLLLAFIVQLLAICVNSEIYVRMTNGSSQQSGRVEVSLNRYSWGTVCDDDWDFQDARVVCQMLGYSTGQARSSAAFGKGTGSIYLDDVQCSPLATTLDQCVKNRWGEHNCGHSEDAGVVCSSETGVFVRLVNGTSKSGRVEVSNDKKEWGTVCDDHWDSKSASVVCRQLGFDYGVAKKNAFYGAGTIPIFLDDLRCNGTELSLGKCKSRSWSSHNCKHHEDAGADCYYSDIATRLVGGDGFSSGRLEVSINGEVWGSVCNDKWGSAETNAACQQMGFSHGVVNKNVTQGIGQIMLDDVVCARQDVSLQTCQHQPWGIHNCNHSQDIGITCYSDVTNDSVQLLLGFNSTMTLMAGDLLTAQCVVRSVSPPANIIWQLVGNNKTQLLHNFTQFRNGSFESLYNISSTVEHYVDLMDDGNMLYCLFPDFTGGFVKSHGVLLKILYWKPVAVLPVSPLPWFSGENQSLSCNFQETDRFLISYEWTRDGDIIMGEQKHILHIGPLSRLHNGLNYSCTVKNVDCEPWCEVVSPPLTLSVEYFPIIEVNTSVTIFENDNLHLHCQADGNPAPIISWHLADETLLASKADLYQQNVSHSDPNLFLCVAYGISAMHGHLAAHVLVNVTVLSPPNVPVIIPSDPFPWYEGDTYNLVCNTSGRGNSNFFIRWYKNGNLTSDGDLTEILIGPVKSDENGDQYKCEAVNTYTIVKEIQKISAPVYLNVYDPPGVPTIALSAAFPWYEGDVHNLTCKSEKGNPAKTSYRWFRNGKILIEGKMQILFNPVQKLDHGAMYTCQVENVYTKCKNWTRETAPIFLDVYYPPGVPTIALSAAFPWYEGDVHNLTCKSEKGNPAKTSYRWFRNGKILIEGKMQILFNPVQKLDHGAMYTCQVENVYTKCKNWTRETAPIFLDVYYPPGVPTIALSAAFPWYEGDVHNLTCKSEKGNPAKTSYRWFRNGKILIEGKMQILFNPVQKLDHGAMYTCQVENVYTKCKNWTRETAPIFLDVYFMKKEIQVMILVGSLTGVGLVVITVLFGVIFMIKRKKTFGVDGQTNQMLRCKKLEDGLLPGFAYELSELILVKNED